MTFITDILRNTQLSDVDLDNLIQSYLDGMYYDGPNTTVTQWRIDNYAKLREVSYPPVPEYTDAQVKINSGIPELETEGQTQLNNYIQNCLDVKTRFPKK